MRREFPPVEKLSEPEIAEVRGRVAGFGVDRRGFELGNQIAPGDDDLLPLFRIDRKAVAVAKSEIGFVDQLNPAKGVGAVAFHPEAEAGGVVPGGIGFYRTD